MCPLAITRLKSLTLLVLNASMFVAELDMLADALVYRVSLYDYRAGAVSIKTRAAVMSGGVQILRDAYWSEKTQI